jgi:hypothetical protein
MIYINYFQNTDDWNDHYIFVTNKDCAKLIEQIEECFEYENVTQFLENLNENNADDLLIKYVKTYAYDLCSPYDFTYNFLENNGFLLDHKEYNFTY